MSHCMEVSYGHARKTIQRRACRMRGLPKGSAEVRGDGCGSSRLRAVLLRPRVLCEVEDRGQEVRTTRRNCQILISSPPDHRPADSAMTSFTPVAPRRDASVPQLLSGDSRRIGTRTRTRKVYPLEQFS